MRRAVHRREKLKNRQSACLPEGRLRLGETRARSSAPAAGRSSRSCGSEVLTRLHLQETNLHFQFLCLSVCLYCLRDSRGLQVGNGQGDHQVPRISSNRPELLSSHRFQLREGSSSIPVISDPAS